MRKEAPPAEACAGLASDPSALDALGPQVAAFRSLFAHHRDGAALLDPHGRVVASNACLRRLLCAPGEELRGSFLALLLPAAAERVSGCLSRALRGEPQAELTTCVRCADGSSLEAAITLLPLMGSRGASGLLAIVREITGLAAAERALGAAERERQRIARLNAAILDSLPAHVALLDASGRILAVNAAWRRFGRENGLGDPSGCVGASYLEICDAAAAAGAQSAAEIGRLLREVLAGKRRLASCVYPCHSASERRWFRLHACAVDDPAPLGAVVLHLDVTTSKLAADQARVAANALRQLTEGVLVIDGELRALTSNQAYRTLTGYSAAETAGLELTSLFATSHGPLLVERMRFALERQGHWQGQVRVRRKDGSDFPAHLSMAAVRGESARSEHFVAVLSDLSAQMDYERRLNLAAQQDALTGLANRAALGEHARLLIASAQEDAQPLLLMLIGVDRLKLVNDSLGHAMGDALLQAVAARLRGACPPGEVLARVSGDEFALLISGSVDPDDAEHRARLICEAMGPPIMLGEQPLYATVSIGIAHWPADGSDFEALLRSADVAMRAAKQAGGNCARRHVSDMGGRYREHLALQTDLRLALERDEFVLHYQPTVEVHTRRAVSAEALIRWRHPRLGLLAPGRFIAMAEESGAIVPLSWWVLRAACADAARWPESLCLAVNLSARQFEAPDLARRIGEVLLETGLDPGRLCLEVTEGTVMSDPQAACAVLSELAAMGIGIALDDFGTGYSSLSYLQQFPLHRLKIDRSFVGEIDRSESSREIARAVVALGAALHMRVVAEGVETERQLHFVRQIGCHEVQGFLFCRPLPAGELLRWLASRPGRAD